MHAGAGRSSAMMAYRLGGADLEPGDTVTFVYGDTSGGSRGFAVQSMATRRFVLPVYVDLDGGGKFFSPAWDSLGSRATRGRVARRLRAVGGRARRALHARDPRRRPLVQSPHGSDPGWEVRLGDEVLASVPAGGSAIAEVDGLTLRAPGAARLDVRSTDGKLVARSNPIWVRETAQPRIVWGELHGHTDFAEAQGTPEEYYDYGAEDARLDFMALTEHDSWLDAAEWQTLQSSPRRTNAEGRVIAFLAYEWTAQRPTGGHHNVIFRSTDREMVPFADAPTLPELYRGLHAEAAPEDVLVIPHAHTAGDWTQSDPALERLVEMYSMHGTFEWFANLYLRNGWEVGFVGGSDDHRAKPGLARSSYIETLGQRGGLAAAIVPEKSPGRDLRRAARVVVLRHLGAAHPARRRPRRVRHGHAPAGRGQAQAARARRRHRADRSHRRGQERRGRAVARLRHGAAVVEGLGAGRVRVVVRGLPAAERQPAALPGVGGHARRRRRDDPRRSTRPASTTATPRA